MPLKVAVFGEALYDLIEQTDNQLSAHIGGSPFNVARSFAKQGVNTSYLSPISTDRYGQRIYAYASGEGIKLPSQNRSTLPTSLALVYMDELGQPDYSLYRKQIADLDINADTLLAITPSDIELFHTGSLALVPSMLEVLIPCFTELKRRKVVISMDINMRKAVEIDHASYVEAVKRLLPYADIVKVSDEDLALLGIDLSPLEGAKYLLSQLQNGLVLLTQGAEGATLLTDSLQLSKPVFKPSVFADAVGAGDTFFSAFLAQLLRDGQIQKSWQAESVEKALTFGLMAATLNIEQHGCQPPTQDDVDNALATRAKHQ